MPIEDQMKRSLRVLAQRLWVACVALSLSACATGPLKPVRDASQPLGEDQALVAFSVAATGPIPMRQLELMRLDNGPGGAGKRPVSVRLAQEEDGLHLFRVPAGTFRFGAVRFAAKDGWWETRHPGPEFVAEPGSLTYLGRIQLHSLRLSNNVEMTRRYLTGVNIRVTDAREEDTARMVREFSLPADLPMQASIPDLWGDSDFTAVTYRSIPGRGFRYEDFSLWGAETGPVGPPPPATEKPQR